MVVSPQVEMEAPVKGIRLAGLIGIPVLIAFLIKGLSSISSVPLVFAVGGLFATLLIATSITLDILRQRFDLFNHKYYALAGLFTFLVVGMVKSLWIYEEPVTDDLQTAVKAALLVNLSIGAFLIGNALPFRGVVRNEVVVISKRRLFAISALYALLGSYVFSVYVTTAGEEELSNAFLWFGHLAPVGAILGIFLLLTYRLKATLLFTIPAMAFSLLVGSRTPLMYIFFFAAAYAIYLRYGGRPRFEPKVLAVLALFLAVSLFAGSALKTVVGTGWQVSDLKDFTVATGHRIQTLEFIDAFDNLCRILELYVDQGLYLYGWSLAAALLNFIPRGLWPDKPYSLGKLLVQDLTGETELTGTSFAPSLLGELVANFGPLAGPMGYFVFGMLARLLYGRFRGLEHDSPYAILYLMSFVLLFLESRG
ncbi:MAG: oligosaccharide repeat unit polymerase, partial [Candidatus Methylomirabilales bacterium]